MLQHQIKEINFLKIQRQKFIKSLNIFIIRIRSSVLSSHEQVKCRLIQFFKYFGSSEDQGLLRYVLSEPNFIDPEGKKLKTIVLTNPLLEMPTMHFLVYFFFSSNPFALGKHKSLFFCLPH